MKWKVVEQKKSSAKENMEKDEHFLNLIAPDDDPILHFYEWEKPSATYGYFMKPSELFKHTDALDLARRPTGGGVLFHLWDLAFSAIVPANHPGYSADIMKNYKFINDAVLLAVKNVLNSESSLSLLPHDPVSLDKYAKYFCFAKPTKYDVMIDGKKIAGAAQRRKRNAFLHQGSISIAAPSFDFIEKILPDNTLVTEAMKLHTYFFLNNPTQSEFSDAREALKKELKKELMNKESCSQPCSLKEG